MKNKYSFSVKWDSVFCLRYAKNIHFDLFSIHFNHFGREFSILGIKFRWDRKFKGQRVKNEK